MIRSTVSPSAIEPELEWDRMRSYLRAETGPLAVIEIESEAQAEELVEAVRSECGDACAVEVYRPAASSADGEDPRNVLEWLAARQTPAFRDAVFLVLGLGKLAAEGERTREFWTWMDSQRERWRPAAGKLAFVLTPRQVDDLCRFASALWDWIPLKFNFLRISRAEPLGEQERGALFLDREHPGEAARLIPALREQLLMARQQGLTESVVRREYAWPLFRVLTRAHHLREAAAVLDTDLSGDFAAELVVADQLDWWLTVGEFSLKRRDLPAGERACRALIEVAQRSDDVEKIAAGYHRLGRIAEERREFDEAEQWYRKSLAIFEELGAEHRAASAYHQLGIIAQQRRAFDEAEQWYRKSLATFEELGDEHRSASAYHQLGIIAQQRRKFDHAEQWYRKSLGISEKFGDEHGAAITYHQLGRIAEERRAFDEAEQWFRKSLAIKEKLGIEHGAASTYHHLGRVAEERRNLDAAEQWHRKALAIFEKLGDRHGAAMILMHTGYLYVKTGVPQRALEAYDQAFRLFQLIGDCKGQAESGASSARVLRDLGRLTEAYERITVALESVESCRSLFECRDLRTSYFALYQDYYETAVDILMRLYREDPTGNYCAQAFDKNERRLAQELRDILAGNPRYAKPEHHGPVTVAEVQRRILDDQSLLLVYALGEKRSYLWAVSRHELTCHALAPRREIEGIAERVGAELTRKSHTAPQAQAHVAAEFSEIVLAPVAAKLGNRRLVIVADGALQYIPFAALSDPNAQSPDQPLVVNHEIVTLPSISVIAPLRQALADRPASKRSIAAIADPVFDVDDPRLRGDGTLPAATTAPQDLSRANARSLGLSRFQRLPYSRAEAEAILQLVPEGRRFLALEFDASRQTVSGGKLSYYSILHFATHALLNRQHPELSGLVLSLVDEEGRPQDGFLRAHEISTLNLSAELVVLSGCETGLGKGVRSEGLAGLPRAFFQAGARRVIVSLWKISERGTAELMIRFYRAYLEYGLSPAAALRHAQVSMLREPQTAAPYHWAGFVLQGEWR